MAARLPADLLSRPVQEACRLVALSFLDEIGRAQERLGDRLDTEALHDFRVGLRRLRSCLRAYRAHLTGSSSKKTRRRLKDLTLATNAGRDTEVQLAWLRAQAERLAPGEMEGLAWLIGRLEGRKHEAFDQRGREVGRRFLKLAAKLRPRLLTFEVELRMDQPHAGSSFGEVTAGLIRREGADLGEALAGIVKPTDTDEAHAARLSAKRLRYLLEPVSRRAPRIKGIIKRLKGLQDSLGDLHDMQVLAEEIGGAGVPAGVEPVVRILHGAAQERAELAFADFRAHWTEGHELPFLSRVDEAANDLLGAQPAAIGDATRAAAKAGTNDAPATLNRSVAGASDDRGRGLVGAIR